MGDLKWRSFDIESEYVVEKTVRWWYVLTSKGRGNQIDAWEWRIFFFVANCAIWALVCGTAGVFFENCIPEGEVHNTVAFALAGSCLTIQSLVWIFVSASDDFRIVEQK